MISKCSGVLKDASRRTLECKARAHGVGYYAFSQEEAERASQQEALSEQRQETQRQQQLARELREKREKQLQARLKAARARNRARLGLPPEEDEPEPGPSTEEQAATTQDEVAAGKAVEGGEEEAKATEAPRKAEHVRPWDLGKDGVTTTPKIHFEPMSQEEWVQKNRDERLQEFAPSYGNEEEQASSAGPVPWITDRQPSTSFFSSEKAMPDQSMAKSQEEWMQMNRVDRPQEFAPVYQNEEEQAPSARPSPWSVNRQPPSLFFSSKKAKPAMSQEEWVQRNRVERPQEFAPVFWNEEERASLARPSPWIMNRQPSSLFFSSKKARPAMSQEEWAQKNRVERSQEFAPVYGNGEEQASSARPSPWIANRQPPSLFFSSKKAGPAMSPQEERVQKKGDERLQEFAPVYGNEEQHVSSAGPSPWIMDRPPPTLFFSSKKAKPGEPTNMGASSSKRISHLLGERVVPQPVVPMKRTKIENELSGGSSSDEDTRGMGAEIGPPPPHEYMMSSPRLPRPSGSVPKSEIEKSIEIGLAKLRREYEEKRRRGDEKQGGIYDFLPK